MGMSQKTARRLRTAATVAAGVVVVWLLLNVWAIYTVCTTDSQAAMPANLFLGVEVLIAARILGPKLFDAVEKRIKARINSGEAEPDE